MYRQVQVNKKHQNYQRILWRTDSNSPIREFNLKTVTYGTASAPFLAVRCLIELATIGRDQYPLASAILKRDFYVDDVMSGANDIELAQQAQAQLTKLLESAGFELHKWRSNSSKLVAESTTSHAIKDNQEAGTNATKTLGIYWHPEDDYFSFQVAEVDSINISKRSILSQTAKLFDPLGWIAPVIMTAKLIMQQLWLSGVGWDDHPPTDIVEKWTQYTSTLKTIANIKIPRKMIGNQQVQGTWQLHGFSDSSELAYGAVIYIRSGNHGEQQVRLVCSKSRVAPLKRLSIPRLELCGALLLARLLSVVSSILKVQNKDIVAWTDSRVVLAWLNKHPHHWKPFVANRVTQVQELIPPEHWKHIRSKENPADCLTRGLSPRDIQHHSLWWSGPLWLGSPEADWPAQESPPVGDEMEAKTVRSMASTCLVVTELDPALPTQMSSWSRLVRVTAYCLRFGTNCRLKQEDRNRGWLTRVELNRSELYWIRQVQQESFKQEIQQCSKSPSVLQHGQMRQLNPFVDAQEILRVGGRLKNAPVPYDQRHPIILPSNHHITRLIVVNYHKLYLHAGPQLLLAVLRTKFWIIKAKQLIRKLIHECIKCFKHKIITSQQLMGDLPKHRVEPARPFTRSGIDYAGPISIRAYHGRGRVRVFKAYICIIVCFATKAIHLELAGDLTTQSFLGALRRFCSRRGKPSDIYTDCGTNFVGAHRELKELQALIASRTHNEQIANALTQDGIDWHFNPPAAPHFGGLWEAGVKSTKFHLRRTIGLTMLTYEELNTLLTQIEACLNSRPMCPISSEPDDLAPLTPGHFLIGESLTALPDQDYTHFKLHQLNRWQLIQQKLQHFWKRWTVEYLSRLQQRPKWCTPQPNLKIGDLIVLKGETTSPLHWRMARVVQTHPGTDGLVRAVTLRTANGMINRPIAKCCLLPITDNT